MITNTSMLALQVENTEFPGDPNRTSIVGPDTTVSVRTGLAANRNNRIGEQLDLRVGDQVLVVTGEAVYLRRMTTADSSLTSVAIQELKAGDTLQGPFCLEHSDALGCGHMENGRVEYKVIVLDI